MSTRITFLLLNLISFSVLFAQEMKTKELNEIQVEAGKAKIYPDANRIITVIDKAEIEKLPIQNLDELLDRVAGLDVRQRGT